MIENNIPNVYKVEGNIIFPDKNNNMGSILLLFF